MTLSSPRLLAGPAMLGVALFGASLLIGRAGLGLFDRLAAPFSAGAVAALAAARRALADPGAIRRRPAR